MSILMKINNVDMTQKLLRFATWSLNKRWSTETFNFTVRNEIFGPQAYRVPIGSSVHIMYGDHLMFGGQVTKIEEYRAGDEGPIFVDVSCICWDLLAYQIILTGETAEQPISTLVQSFWAQYLQGKGVYLLDFTEVGPTVPKMTFVKASLGEIFNRITKYVNWPWRINGDRWLAFVKPGSLPIPLQPAMETHHFLKGVRVAQDYYEYGNYLIINTGGTGEAVHKEEHTADGTKKYFLVNVEARPDEVKEENDIETVTSYQPTKFWLNGVETQFNGSPWNWDKGWQMAWTSGAAPAAGTVLKFEHQISFPSTVRVWAPEALSPDGHPKIATLVQKLMDASHLTNVTETKKWGEVELFRYGRTPRKVRGATIHKGFYPYLTGRLFLPEHNIDASFLLENVNVTDSGIDTAIHNHLIYNLEFIEGDRAGRQWEDLFTEQAGRGGQGGSIAVSGTGGSVLPSGDGGTGGGGTGTVGYPVGHTFQLGGDNTEYVAADATWRDVTEALPFKFGGSDMAGNWTMRIFGYIIKPGSGTLEIGLFAGGALVGSGQLTGTGDLTIGPFDVKEAPVTRPGGMVDTLLRYRSASGTFNAIIGHCVLYRAS